MHWSEKLRDLNACDEAVEWAATQPDLKMAWAKCERADWMLWLAAKKLDRRLVVQAACDCAETALEFLSGPALTQAILTLHITREWCENREDLDTVRAAADAATYTADAAAYAAAAAHTAYAAAAAAAHTAYAAHTAHTAHTAAAAAAREQALRSMADLVRARIPEIGEL